MLLRIFELSIIFFLIWTGLTQIIIPFFRGTPIFPFFRKERKLEGGIAEARQSNLERDLKDKLDSLNEVCSTCKYPANRTCTKKESPNYNKKVLSTDTCPAWERKES